MADDFISILIDLESISAHIIFQQVFSIDNSNLRHTSISHKCCVLCPTLNNQFNKINVSTNISEIYHRDLTAVALPSLGGLWIPMRCVRWWRWGAKFKKIIYIIKLIDPSTGLELVWTICGLSLVSSWNPNSSSFEAYIRLAVNLELFSVFVVVADVATNWWHPVECRQQPIITPVAWERLISPIWSVSHTALHCGSGNHNGIL